MPSRRDLLIGAGVAVAAPTVASAEDAAPACVISTWDFGAAANAEAFAARRAGGTAVDMVEAGARVPEADPTNHSVGFGGYPDRDGHVTLDAVIMDQAGNVGAVCALEDIVHAVSVARAVMEKTPHTMLVGAGARSFAIDQGFETTELLTPEAEAAWRDWLVTANYAPRANSENTDWRSTPGGPGNHDTIGILAMDARRASGRGLHDLWHGVQDARPGRRQPTGRRRPVGRAGRGRRDRHRRRRGRGPRRRLPFRRRAHARGCVADGRLSSGAGTAGRACAERPWPGIRWLCWPWMSEGASAASPCCPGSPMPSPTRRARPGSSGPARSSRTRPRRHGCVWARMAR